MRDSVHCLEPGDAMLQTLNVNAIGAVRVTRALLPNLCAGRERKIVHVGSILGSTKGLTTGDSFGYRMSKAPLCVASRALACGLRDQGIISVVVHPGWIQTRMGGPRAALPVEESALAIVRLVMKLSPRDTGAFLDYRGRVLRA